jgi:hypothetical protein
VNGIPWSAAEKKLAREVFDRALNAELQETLEDFKERARKAQEPSDLWDIRDHLERRQRDIDQKYDYRYSQLLMVFGRLLREGRITEEEISTLSDEKLEVIRRVASI